MIVLCLNFAGSFEKRRSLLFSLIPSFSPGTSPGPSRQLIRGHPGPFGVVERRQTRDQKLTGWIKGGKGLHAAPGVWKNRYGLVEKRLQIN